MNISIDEWMGERMNTDAMGIAISDTQINYIYKLMPNFTHLHPASPYTPENHLHRCFHLYFLIGPLLGPY